MVSQNRHLQSFQRLLGQLAGLYGVQTGYRDTRGHWQVPPPESVVKVLSALGAQVDSDSLGSGRRGDGVTAEARLKSAIQVREAQLRDRIVEPVVVAWDGVLAGMRVGSPLGDRNKGTQRRPGDSGRGPVRLTLLLEEGNEERWDVGRDRFCARSSQMGPTGPGGGRLPFGYHRLRVEAGSSVDEATVISSPRRCWTSGTASALEWGLFAPLYALPGERNWGAGDLADLERLCEWVGSSGGSVVATLPLLAAYLEHPSEPAPYRPVSRLFWNEFYLAVDRIVEWEHYGSVRERSGSDEFRHRVAALRAEPAVDYREIMALKRKVLAEASRCFFAEAEPARKAAFAEYVRTHPDAEAYAAFRAQRKGVAGCETERYHLYCQWQMEEQLGRLPQRQTTVQETGAVVAGQTPAGLLLDLPVGVHPGGFDVWRWPELFAPAMSVGAPPDSFFASGQNWNSPPLLPDRIRAQGHHYFARCIRNLMRHTQYLRIDHMMSLHRLFWIPEGREPAEGVYVTYPTGELYAVLCQESHRNRVVVVGEDLGTVGAGVRTAMRRHGMLRTWVLQSSLRPRAAQPVAPVPRQAVAELGTHDMFPFVGFLRGEDIVARVETGQLDGAGARRELAARRRLVGRLTASLPRKTDSAPAPTAAPVVGEGTPASATLSGGESGEAELLRQAILYLAASEAPLVVLNVEDLLLETKPQNLPGTTDDGNWRRKLRGSDADVQRAIVEASQIMLADRGPRTLAERLEAGRSQR